MATTIVTKNSSTASAVPTAAQLVQGELAVNVADKRIYTENNAGAVVELGTNPYNFTANHNGSSKLATTATGIDVTGTATMDGLVVNGEITGPATNNLTIRSKYSATIDIDSDNNQTDRNFQVIHDGSKLILKAEESGNISFYEDTGTTAKLFWDASFERLSIDSNTVNPLVISRNGGTDANVSIKFDCATSDYYVGTNPANNFGIGISSDLTSAPFQITSAGRVGIGTSAALGKVHIETQPSGAGITPSSNGDELVLENNSNCGLTIGTENLASIFFGKAADSDIGGIGYLMSDNSMRFTTNAAERMRIDSAGNLLVGKTAVSNATVGFQVGQDGFVAATRASGQPLVLNRTTTDGIIADFRKDGTTVGAIGNYGGLALDVGRGTTAVLRFRDSLNAIYPAAGIAGGTSDGVTSLGISTGRFKDLYLSGGVYLGGTGAANLLDDYEEGTWTPVLTRTGASTNATITLDGAARYTKVGSLVTLNFYISAISNFPTDGTSAIIQGLPFSANQWGAGSIGYGTATNCSYTTWALNAATGYFLNNDNNGFRNGTIDLNRGMFTISYQTNA